MNTSNVIINAKELAELLTAAHILSALTAGGVDNWEWYSESLSDYRETHGDTDISTEEVIEKYPKVG